MRQRTVQAGLVAILAVLIGSGPLWSCSVCDSRLLNTPTFRQEAAQATARVILAGTVRNPRPSADGRGGVSDLHIDAVLRPDPVVKDKKVIELPRLLPVIDPKSPPRYLVFCDVVKGGLDPYRGVPLRGVGAIEYLKKALALTNKDPIANLVFFFRYIDDPDPEVARDAFLEFARASDQQVAEVAPRLDAAKLRALLSSDKTPAGQLGLLAVLLGSAGHDTDAARLRGLLDRNEDRYNNAADGILAGYLTLRPREGWELVQSILKDTRRPLDLRLAAVRTLRFLHASRPKENRARVLEGMQVILAQEDLADLAVEDLRRWEMWDLTPTILALYGRKGYDAPLMQQAILRYTLCARPTPEVKEFLNRRRAAEPETVKQVEEGLALERGR
jgi:hypothetical protein